MWCLSLENFTRKSHPTVRVEVGDGTMREFTNNYLSENGLRTQIIGQLSINWSVRFFCIPDFSEIVDCCLFITCKLPLRPLVGYIVIPPLINGELFQRDLTSMLQWTGVLSSLHVQFTFLGVWSTHALLHAVSVMTFFVVGIMIVWGVSTQVAILSSNQESIIMVTIRRVQLLNNFVAKFYF